MRTFLFSGNLGGNAESGSYLYTSVRLNGPAYPQLFNKSIYIHGIEIDAFTWFNMPVNQNPLAEIIIRKTYKYPALPNGLIVDKEQNFMNNGLNNVSINDAIAYCSNGLDNGYIKYKLDVTPIPIEQFSYSDFFSITGRIYLSSSNPTSRVDLLTTLTVRYEVI